MRIYDTGLGANFFNMLKTDLREEELITPDVSTKESDADKACRFAAAHPEAVTILMKETKDGEFIPQDIVVRM